MNRRKGEWLSEKQLERSCGEEKPAEVFRPACSPSCSGTRPASHTMAGEETQGAGDQGGGILDRFKAYARSRKGTILLAEMVISLTIFICFCASVSVGYTTAPLVEFFLSLGIFSIFMNGFDKSLSFIHWPCTDFIRCGIAVIIYIIIGIIGLTNGYGATIAAGVFSLLAAAIFAYDGYLCYQMLNLKRHTPAPTEPSDNSA